MCTTAAKCGDGLIFGRNMDIERNFSERLVVTPRNFEIKYKCEKPSTHHYAFMGTAAVANGHPLYAEGVNEKGLCAASLNFANNAIYRVPEKDTDNIYLAPYELIPKLLADCSNISEAKSFLERVILVNIPFSQELPLSTLHFHIADSKESIVFESTAEGCKTYENTACVLSNDPTFPAQKANLSAYNYMGASKTPLFYDEPPYSLGTESLGLPGGFSSMSRFVRGAYILQKTDWVCKREEKIYRMFDLLGLVSVPKGAVYDKGKQHFTTYSCCIDASVPTYYYRTYKSLNTLKLSLSDFDIDSDRLFTAEIY